MGRTKGSGSKKGDAAASAPKQTAEGLSDDQRYSLVEQHRQKYERLLAAKKSADKALKDLGKIIKADLGDTGMDEIKGVIEGKTPEGEAAIKARIERDARVLRWLGVPIGTQSDLFPTDRTPLAERSFNEGKRQGLAGENNNNPHHQSTEAYHKHNEGYATGQEMLATRGFSKLDDTPKGSVPRDQWQKDIAEQNKQTEDEIKQTAAEIQASASLGSSRPTFQVV